MFSLTLRRRVRVCVYTWHLKVLKPNFEPYWVYTPKKKSVISFKVRQWMSVRFQFKWIPFIIVMAMLVVMINLGFWQIRRYDQKQGLLNGYQQSLSKVPYTWHDFIKASDKVFHRVKIQGVYLNNKSMLLDNRWYKNKIGYEVLTPFQIQGEKKVLLINRGWIPRGRDRQQLPKITPIVGKQSVQGYINKPILHNFILGNAIESHARWPLRLQKINFKEIANAIDQPIYAYVLRLSKSALGGFVRQWVVVVGKPSRHLGYAVQWFLMSLALIIAYFIFSCRQSKRKKTGG